MHTSSSVCVAEKKLNLSESNESILHVLKYIFLVFLSAMHCRSRPIVNSWLPLRKTLQSHCGNCTPLELYKMIEIYGFRPWSFKSKQLTIFMYIFMISERR